MKPSHILWILAGAVPGALLSMTHSALAGAVGYATGIVIGRVLGYLDGAGR